MKAPPPLLRLTRGGGTVRLRARAGLPGVSATVLASRLRQLERGEGAVTVVAGEPSDLERFLEVFRFADPVPA